MGRGGGGGSIHGCASKQHLRSPSPPHGTKTCKCAVTRARACVRVRARMHACARMRNAPPPHPEECRLRIVEVNLKLLVLPGVRGLAQHAQPAVLVKRGVPDRADAGWGVGGV